MWKDYLRAPEATEADVEATAEALGVTFPSRFVRFLATYQA